MDLSNLRPADGAKHSDNFRRGRGHGSGNGKTAGKRDIKARRLVQEQQDLVLKVARCHCIQKNTKERVHLQKL